MSEAFLCPGPGLSDVSLLAKGASSELIGQEGLTGLSPVCWGSRTASRGPLVSISDPGTGPIPEPSPSRPALTFRECLLFQDSKRGLWAPRRAGHQGSPSPQRPGGSSWHAWVCARSLAPSLLPSSAQRPWLPTSAPPVPWRPPLPAPPRSGLLGSRGRCLPMVRLGAGDPCQVWEHLV